ncbi:MAG: crossover junction endodeoxyribonuclease RuvC [Rhodospirillales bacterium]|nr:crossover junction endodeoxyribonuclease RuvC [Rhodospirillales bacterium]MCB9995727.1 crossover junction endodeoxyribonuclease RuvC [Rhodospirillales bacterium]
MRILGIDPGLQKTGWGIIEIHGNRLSFLGCGLIKTQPALPLYARLATLDEGLTDVVRRWMPDIAALEETFMNNNAASALKLGQARGVCMVAPARLGLEVHEYAANLVKKSLVGTGHATKDQIGLMVRTLLPKVGKVGPDEADALAIAICHAHHSQTAKRIAG